MRGLPAQTNVARVLVSDIHVAQLSFQKHVRARIGIGN